MITEVAEQIGFSDVKAKGSYFSVFVWVRKIFDFCSYQEFLIKLKEPVRQIQQNSSTFSIQETCCYVLHQLNSLITVEQTSPMKPQIDSADLSTWKQAWS